MIAEISSGAVPGTVPLPANSAIHSPEEVVRIFLRKRKRVVTFLGYGELGYADTDALMSVISKELDRFDPASTVVNTGTLVTAGYRRGIVDVYEAASRRDFETTGIHPSIALTVRGSYGLSWLVHETYFVHDETWGGLSDEERRPSPTLRVLLAVTDEVIAVGGGKHTAQELEAFLRAGKPVRFHPAEMDHALSRRWASNNGVVLAGFEGEAQLVWDSWQGRTPGQR